MDLMLNLGIDGWKCDGTDPYIIELGEAKGYNGTVGWQCVKQGHNVHDKLWRLISSSSSSPSEYSDLYYGDFFDYTRR